MIRRRLARTLTKALALVLTVGAVGAVWQPLRVEAQDDTPVPMYRMYNPNSGEHFYTGNPAERSMLMGYGWNYEGIGWYAPASSSQPVYRLYNPNAGDHHYTLNAGERDYLVSVGWNDEGIGWYSDEAQRAALYRQYNPNAKAGAHNFTTSKAENDFLTGQGWSAEGIAWYGIREGSPADRVGGIVTIDQDPGYASIEADVTLHSTNCKGAHAKFLIGGGGAIASFGIQYAYNTNQFSTKTAFLLENVFDRNKAGIPGPDGKNYVFISQASRDTTYKLRLSWEKDSNTLHCYVNDEELAIDSQMAKTNMRSGNFSIGVECSGMSEGDQVSATFSNIKIRLGDSADRRYGTVGDPDIRSYYGLTGRITNYGTNGPTLAYQNTRGAYYNWSAELGGTVSGTRGYDWDSIFNIGNNPISSQIMFPQDQSPD